jgi:hypothetical protein
MEWRRPEVEVRVHTSMRKNGDRAPSESECLSWEIVILPSFPSSDPFVVRCFDQYDYKWDSFQDRRSVEKAAMDWTTGFCAALGVSSFTIVPYKLKIVHVAERDDARATSVKVP